MLYIDLKRLFKSSWYSSNTLPLLAQYSFHYSGVLYNPTLLTATGQQLNHWAHESVVAGDVHLEKL